MKKAETLADLHQSCAPRPLRQEELEEFFVSIDDARDPVLSQCKELQKVLERERRSLSKLLLAGHTGTGKSTELARLEKELGRDFFVVSFSAADECNLVHVSVEDLLVVMMERLVRVCLDQDLDTSKISNAALKDIYDWFADTVDSTHTKVESSAEAEAGVDVSQSYWGKLMGLLARTKVGIKRSNERTRATERQLPHRLNDLVDRCNLLLKEVQRVLDDNQRTLLVIIEDLDKANLEDARRIFIEQTAVLADLATNLICTIPIFLLHSPERVRLERSFETHVLPMPKVTTYEGKPCAEGRQAMREILERRLDMRLIRDDALERLIEATGGVLRDVFKVLVTAAAAAESLHDKGHQEAVITRQNIEYSLARLRNDYAISISTINLPAQWQVELGELYQRLQELSHGPRKMLPSDHASMLLLQCRAVLEYNGERWFALHPLVQEFVAQLP